jgi:hypothetical protein
MDLPATAPVIALPVAMIEPSFGALLVPAVGAPSLADAGMLTAWGAAVALSAVAVRADEEHCMTLATKANSLPEYRFAMNCRHASSQADWTTALVSWQVGTSSVWFTWSGRVAELGTLPLQRQGSIRFPPLMTRYFVQPSVWMIGPMIAPSAR